MKLSVGVAMCSLWIALGCVGERSQSTSGQQLPAQDELLSAEYTVLPPDRDHGIGELCNRLDMEAATEQFAVSREEVEVVFDVLRQALPSFATISNEKVLEGWIPEYSTRLLGVRTVTYPRAVYVAGVSRSWMREQSNPPSLEAMFKVCDGGAGNFHAVRIRFAVPIRIQTGGLLHGHAGIPVGSRAQFRSRPQRGILSSHAGFLNHGRFTEL